MINDSNKYKKCREQQANDIGGTSAGSRLHGPFCTCNICVSSRSNIRLQPPEFRETRHENLQHMNEMERDHNEAPSADQGLSRHCNRCRSILSERESAENLAQFNATENNDVWRQQIAPSMDATSIEAIAVDVIMGIISFYGKIRQEITSRDREIDHLYRIIDIYRRQLQDNMGQDVSYTTDDFFSQSESSIQNEMPDDTIAEEDEEISHQQS